MTTALAPQETFEVTVAAVGRVLTPTGLDPDTDLSQADAMLVLRGTGRIDSSVRWLRGDVALRLLASVEDGRKGQAYEKLAKQAEVEPSAIKWEASVCRAWPYQWRVTDVSMSHHSVLMGTVIDNYHDKQWWLERALEEEWSVERLRYELRQDLGQRNITVSSYMNARDWLTERGIRFKAQDQGRKLIFESGPSMLTVEYATRGDGMELEYTITEEA
jgi:hypothetical protein